MQSKYIIIFGSSRSNGHTRKAVDIAFENVDHEFLDLQHFSISEFDYEARNHDDDFLSVIEKMRAYDHIVFATPIYWYGPSSKLKIFLDRFSDLLKDPLKDIGRSLRGKKIYVVSSNGTSASPTFEKQFELICEYMSMEYMGCYNYHSGEDKQQLSDSEQSLIAFRKKISS